MYVKFKYTSEYQTFGKRAIVFRTKLLSLEAAFGVVNASGTLQSTVRKKVHFESSFVSVDANFSATIPL